MIKSVFSFQDQAEAVVNWKNLARFSLVNVSHTPWAETMSGSLSSEFALDVPKEAFLEEARTTLLPQRNFLSLRKNLLRPQFCSRLALRSAAEA